MDTSHRWPNVAVSSSPNQTECPLRGGFGPVASSLVSLAVRSLVVRSVAVGSLAFLLLLLVLSGLAYGTSLNFLWYAVVGSLTTLLAGWLAQRLMFDV